MHVVKIDIKLLAFAGLALLAGAASAASARRRRWLGDWWVAVPIYR